jgi:Pentapeptide repeats (8 copies)
VPDLADRTESEQATARASPPQQPAPAWWSSLWLWPAVAIALAGIAGALFGALGALLVGGEALAALVVFAGTLAFSRDRWPAIALGAAVAASLAVFVGLAWLKLPHHWGGPPRATATASAPAPRASWTPSANWSWHRVSQAMAQHANFRGADLNGANLAGLQLSHKNFDGVQANGASFRGSQLAFASFRGASLRDACLEGAILTGADLAGADLTGADIAGVKVSRRAKKAALVWPRRHAKPAAACQ